MSTLQHKLHSEPTTEHDYFALYVRRNEDYFALQLRDGTSLGQLNKRASRALSGISDIDSVRFSAFVEKKVVIALAREATSPSSRIFKIDINVYGAEAIAQEVGERLSSVAMFLQDPDRGLDGVCYFNPHILSFPDIEMPMVASDTVGSNDGSADGDGAGQVGLKTAISQIYRSVTRYRDLERTTGGSHIISKLREYVWSLACRSYTLSASNSFTRHQEKALNFMLQREEGPVHEQYSLWVTEEENGAPVYCTPYATSTSIRTYLPNTTI